MKRKPKEKETKTKKDITLHVVNEKEQEGKFSLDKNDVSLLARKFSKFLLRSKRNKQRNLSRLNGKEDGKKDNNQIICYECNKSGYIRQDCPLRKKKKG